MLSLSLGTGTPRTYTPQHGKKRKKKKFPDRRYYPRSCFRRTCSCMIPSPTRLLGPKADDTDRQHAELGVCSTFGHLKAAAVVVKVRAARPFGALRSSVWEYGAFQLTYLFPYLDHPQQPDPRDIGFPEFLASLMWETLPSKPGWKHPALPWLSPPESRDRLAMQATVTSPGAGVNPLAYTTSSLSLGSLLSRGVGVKSYRTRVGLTSDVENMSSQVDSRSLTV